MKTNIFFYYLLVIFLFSVQVRKVVMDTMKNIHPIYNIKVGWSCGRTLVCYTSQLRSSHSCPVKMFSILVLDHLTEKQSLWVCVPRLAQPGAEAMNQIQKYVLAQMGHTARPKHFASLTFTLFTALPRFLCWLAPSDTDDQTGALQRPRPARAELGTLPA